MAKRDFLLRYSYIINKLRTSKYATYEEIKETFDKNKEIFDCELNSKRTFLRDINDIRSIFKIDIQCRRKDSRYYIKEYAEHNSAQEYMLESFDIFNTFNIVGKHSPYIHFEKRKSKGTEHIVQLVQAIKKKYIVKFKHHSYQEKFPTSRTV